MYSRILFGKFPSPPLPLQTMELLYYCTQQSRGEEEEEEEQEEMVFRTQKPFFYSAGFPYLLLLLLRNKPSSYCWNGKTGTKFRTSFPPTFGICVISPCVFRLKGVFKNRTVSLPPPRTTES